MPDNRGGADTGNMFPPGAKEEYLTCTAEQKVTVVCLFCSSDAVVCCNVVKAALSV